MEEKLKNLISKIKESKLTLEEKNKIRDNLNSFIDNNSEKKRSLIFYYSSPYVYRSTFVIAKKIVSVMVLVAIVSTGGLSYASASSLPGDFLYPIKIHLRERIEEKLAFTPEKKVALRQKRINTRFGEVETLIKEKKITKEKLFLIQSKIEKEKKKAGDDLAKLKKENTEAAGIAEITMETSIEEHKEKIGSLISEEKKEIPSLMTTEENKGVLTTEGETDFYNGTKSDLDITQEDLDALLKSDSNIGEAKNSGINDLEIIPFPINETVPPLPPYEIDKSTTESNNKN